MNKGERVSGNEDEIPTALRLFYRTLRDMGETDLIRMMEQDEIGLVLVPRISIQHRNGYYEEKFLRLIDEVNEGEKRAALGLVISQTIEDDPNLVLNAAQVVVDIEDKLAEFKNSGLKLEKVESVERIQRMMGINGYEARDE